MFKNHGRGTAESAGLQDSLPRSGLVSIKQNEREVTRRRPWLMPSLLVSAGAVAAAATVIVAPYLSGGRVSANHLEGPVPNEASVHANQLVTVQGETYGKPYLGTFTVTVEGGKGPTVVVEGSNELELHPGTYSLITHKGNPSDPSRGDFCAADVTVKPGVTDVVLPVPPETNAPWPLNGDWCR